MFVEKDEPSARSLSRLECKLSFPISEGSQHSARLRLRRLNIDRVPYTHVAPGGATTGAACSAALNCTPSWRL